MAIVKRKSSKAKVGKLENYLKQEDKTEEKLISGLNCDSDNFAKQCEMTNLLYKKNDKKGDRKYYHIVQSFSPKDNDKLTYEQAHKIGMKFAEKNFKGHEVLVVTHKDKDHIHNHFVVNSVNLENGIKYRADNKSLWNLRKTSNELCKENGLTHSIQDLDKKAKEKFSDVEMRGKNSWQGDLKNQIIEVSKSATSLDDFRKQMNEKYKVETQIVTRTRKGKKEEILEYKPKDNRKFFDGERRLGTEFGKEHINEFTRGNAEKERARTGEPRTEKPSGAIANTTIANTTIRDRQLDLNNTDIGIAELKIERAKQELARVERERETNREREKQNGTRTEKNERGIDPATKKPTHEPRTR